MSKEEIDYKELIIAQLYYQPCMRATPLSVNIMNVIGPGNFERKEFQTALNGLLYQGKVVAVTFSVNDGPEQTIYFPQGTSFNFGGVRVN